ncbi:polysaccharide biosynthesis/export family protein [bacterium]|nr:polysaccharide biosynthesis/export family protein [bacterium]
MRKFFPILCVVALAFSGAAAQSYEDLLLRQTTTASDQELPKLFEEKDLTQEALDEWQKKREVKLRERIAQGDALENALDPNQYRVGPGDVFQFNVWGVMQSQVPLAVNPEGKLAVPSVGEIEVSGRTLAEAKALVLEKAAPLYANSRISVSLAALRFFRVHIIGEVKFPGTYMAQAVDRVTELIAEAGGMTNWAWPREIEIRHDQGDTTIYDYSAFEREGDLSRVPFVNGGDVIFVPSVDLQKSVVTVQCDIKSGGLYQISAGEDLMPFLLRIRVVNNNTDVSGITVVRKSGNKGRDSLLKPFLSGGESPRTFPLRNQDRIIIPSGYVYVRGACRNPGAYPFVMNLTAKDYAGMAGADYQSGGMRGLKVYKPSTGKTLRGASTPVQAGDVVEVSQSLGNKLRDYGPILSAFGTMLMAGYYIGVFGDKK